MVIHRRSLLSKLADAFLSCCRGCCVALLCYLSATLQVSGPLVCTYYLFWFCLFTVVQLHKMEPKSQWYRRNLLRSPLHRRKYVPLRFLEVGEWKSQLACTFSSQWTLWHLSQLVPGLQYIPDFFI